MSVFRIHIRPKESSKNPRLAFEYCLKQNVLGVGWGIQVEPGETIDWQTYEKRAALVHDDISNVRYIHRHVAEGSLFWTRDTYGNYYLARSTSGWKYKDTPEGSDLGIVNIFDVEFRKVPAVDEVPGKVVACFRASRTIQSVADEAMKVYTHKLRNDLTGTTSYPLAPIKSIWPFLSAQQVEDLVFLYLQIKGRLVVPHSRK